MLLYEIINQDAITDNQHPNLIPNVSTVQNTRKLLPPNKNPEILLQLADIVSRWCIDVNRCTVAEQNMIEQNISYFPYNGHMFRTVFIFTTPNNKQLTKSTIKKHTDGQRICSWSSSMEGMQEWKDLLGDDMDFEFEPEHDSLLDVLCVQNGVAFNVANFLKALQSTIPSDKIAEHVLWSISRAAGVGEVIARYNNTLQIKVVDEYKNESFGVDENDY